MSILQLNRRSAVTGLLAALLMPVSSFALARGPQVTVYKDPNCGCCSGWAEHLKAAGFSVIIVESSDLGRVRRNLGVPDDLASCHTAEVDGYVVEGHVPALALERLLSERPQGRGLAVPGMPLGSPGMDGPPDIYEVVLFGAQGRRSYGRFRGALQV